MSQTTSSFPLLTRRVALRHGLTGLFAATAAPTFFSGRLWGQTAPSNRIHLGIIGNGLIAQSHVGALLGRDDCRIVALSDVWQTAASRMQDRIAKVYGAGGAPAIHRRFEDLLARPDVDAVFICTPDHWHAPIAKAALLAGKDVYCEKPMTLTVPEGRAICEVCRKTGRIVQIGTQQRSGGQFVQAIALLQQGRIGKIQKATCHIGGAPTSPEIPLAQPPKGLDWNLWQGPVAEAPFRFLPGDNGETKSWSRCHYEFRWWYEYSGGKLTDWGAHHVDIATWGMGKTDTGPVEILPEMVKHPVEFRDGFPTDPSRYNTATEFLLRAKFADGAEIEIRHDGDNGILFEGTEGRLFVNRGRIAGKAVDDLKDNPLPSGALEAAYKNRPLVDHFRNFFEAARDRVEPISDVHSHHRALSTCHLAGIAARLNRKITWNPQTESILGDPQAESLLMRQARRGFETQMG